MANFMLLASILMIMGLIATSSARDFYVGGRDGWVQSPGENYNSWAGRMRFQINDQLVFRYKKGEDSVLVVSKEDYDTCNVQNPIQKMEGGESTFRLDRSGPFYFISGVPDRCSKGEKLIVVVLADRTKKQPPPPPPAAPVSPPSAPPSPSPPAPVSPPSAPPSPSPPVPSPVVSPAPSSVTTPPSAEAPSSGAGGPSQSETGAPPPAQSTPSPPSNSASPALLNASKVTIGGMVALVLAYALLG